MPQVVSLLLFGPQQNLIEVCLEEHSLSTAEDVVFYSSRHVHINNVGRHLFALFYPGQSSSRTNGGKKETYGIWSVGQTGYWLSPNEDIGQWLSSITSSNNNEAAKVVLELRLRFKPGKLSNLRITDPNAFNYYYFQVRSDFRKIKYDRENAKVTTSKVLGISIADALSHILDNHPDISDEEKAVDMVDFSNFLPTSYEKKKKLEWFKKTEIREKMIHGWRNTRKNSFVAKEEFILGITGDLIPNFHSEEYVVDILGLDSVGSLFVVKFDPKIQTFWVKGIHVKDDSDNWEVMSTIADLCYVSVQMNSNRVELSRTNGKLLTLIFDQNIILKSFVSLLDGYYRLSEKWSFSVCSQITCPSLGKLKKLRCHGPVGYEFSINKLRERSDDGKVGYFILRQSSNKDNILKMDIKVSNTLFSTLTLTMDGSLEEPTFQSTSHLPNQSFTSLPDLISHLIVKTSSDGSEELRLNSNLCLPPSENDKCHRLLLCRLPSTSSSTSGSSTNLSASTSNLDVDKRIRSGSFSSTCLGPRVLRVSQLSRMSSSEIVLSTRAQEVKSSGSSPIFSVSVAVFTENQKKVVVKKVKRKEDVGHFLHLMNQWIHIKSDCIVSIIGITLDPLSLVMEYLPLGPFDTFLIKHQASLKPVDLIGAGTSVARALWYLEENRLIHGSIRCHNILVSSYSADSLNVKLSDPLSVCDVTRDTPWMPPEVRRIVKRDNRTFITTNINMSVAADVYAFGTTLWEIFSYGKKPSPCYLSSCYDLMQPFGCPKEIWDVIGECWKDNPTDRKGPQGIVRDMSQILYEVYHSKRSNAYTAIQEPSSRKNSNFIRSILGSNSNLSMRSSVMSKGTITTGISSSTSDLISLSSSNNNYDPYDLEDGPVEQNWMIEVSELSLENGKVLGSGCYGEVVKATLRRYWKNEDEVVAVKRINSSVPADLGSRDLRREFEIMKQLNHENIVEIKGFVEDPQLMLVMEFIEMGSLVSHLKLFSNRQSNGSRPVAGPSMTKSPPLLKFAQDILNGMEYLESKSIVHRDLAARNVLVASESQVKISDFGLAQVINSDYYRIQTQRGLPFRWYSPESLKNGKFSHKSDVWSFGVTLWEMYTFGRDPEYSGVDNDCRLLDALTTGTRLECPLDCPYQVYHIMLECWKFKDEERPTFSQLKSDIQNIVDSS